MKTFENILKIPQDPKRQGIYIDMDTLFDTRFAILEEFDQERAIEMLKANWTERLFDEVPYLTKEQFNTLYKVRDADTLRRAARTPIIGPLRAWLDQANVTMIGTPFGGYTEVFVNFWPYKVSRKAADDFIKKLSDDYLNGTKIFGINIDPSYITPVTVRNYFSALFMSNWDTWIEEMTERKLFEGNLMPNVNLYAPKVFRGEITEDNREMASDKDFFTKMEIQMAPLIGIQFLDIDLFSTPLTKEFAEDFFADTN